MAGIRVLAFVLGLTFLSGLLFSSSTWGQKAGGFEETLFFSDLEDIPLMPGLIELSEQTLSFDKPEGRIVEQAALMGDLGRQDVLVYYGGVLTQLGWGRVSDTRFFRESEYLDLSFFEQNGTSVLKVMVHPAL